MPRMRVAPERRLNSHRVATACNFRAPVRDVHASANRFASICRTTSAAIAVASTAAGRSSRKLRRMSPCSYGAIWPWALKTLPLVGPLLRFLRNPMQVWEILNDGHVSRIRRMLPRRW